MISTVLLLVALANAQIMTLPRAGIVVEAGSHQPVAHAIVTIPGESRTERTGPDGRFTWSSVPPTPFVVVVFRADGRASKPIRLLTLDGGGEVRLEIDPGWSETLTVRGTAPDVRVSAGASTSTETAAGLGLRQPMTIAQAVENVPGVSWISEGQGATPAIRGLARGRTLILVDGTRVSTERGAGPNASFLDPASVARVDVSRGPGSVAYGTDAFGGVIAARTRPVPVDGSLAVRASISAAAGLPQRRADLEVSQGYRHGGVMAGVRLRSFDDYESPNGVVPHSAWEDAGVRLQWVHVAGTNRFSAGWQSDSATDIHRPRSDSNAIVAISPFERSHRLAVAFERTTLGGWRDLRIEGFFGASEERLEQDRLAATGRPRRVDRADSSARDLQVRATARRGFAGVDWTAGAEILRRFDVSATDTAFQYNAAGAVTSTVATASIGSANRTAIGVFAEGSRTVLSWLGLSAGVRGETIHGANRGGFFGDRSVDHKPLAASAAVTVAPHRGLAVTLQASRGFRDPTLTDRFSRGPVGRGFLVGNPDLEPETSRQVDLTMRYGTSRADVHASTYRYHIDNLVERYTTGVDQFGIRNRGRARLSGVEIGARLDAGAGLSFDLVGQASRGRDAVTGTPLNDVAPRSLALIARQAWRDRLTAYVRIAGVFAHEQAGPAEVPTPGYALVDAAASWRLIPALEVRAIVRNALNQSYYSSAGPRWVLAPGRHGLVTIVMTWSAHRQVH